MNDVSFQRPPRPQPKLADFPHRVVETIRFGDLDSQGHVNNAVFATFFESGRVAILRNPVLDMRPDGGNFVLARMEIDYLKELHWPGSVEIRTAIAEIRRSSVVMTQAIFQGEVCIAAGRAVIVLIDQATRKSAPLGAELVERFRGLQG